MANTDGATVAPLPAHWSAHQDKQPCALRLSPPQHHEPTRMRRAGLVRPNVDAGRMDADVLMGVAIERRHGSPGLLIGADGETPRERG